MDIIATNAADRALLEAAQSGAGMRPVHNGSLAQAISQARDLTVNATLRKDEWERIDERVNEEGRLRLTVFDRFRSAGLTESVSVGDIERVTERLDAFTEAQIHYDGEAAAEGDMDRANYETDRRAIPIVSHGFNIGFRQLASSSRRGSSLQVDSAGLAARAVTYKMEDLITNGQATGGPSGSGIPGLTTAANALDVSLGTNWDASGSDITGDVERMLDTAYNGYFSGPFDLHVPKNYWATLQGDYSTQKGDRTYMERILAYDDIQIVVKNQALADDNVLLVQMTRDVMDISVAQMLTTWQWQKTPGATKFRVLMIGGPHIKSVQGEDGTTRNGIIHLS